jgi:hypothetical protein
MVGGEETKVARHHAGYDAMGDERDGIERAELSPSDLELARRKRTDANRLGFAVLLLFFRRHGRFPQAASEVSSDIVTDLARQLGIAVSDRAEALLTDRTAERHRAEIRVLLGFREATVADSEALTQWLRDHAAADNHDVEKLTAVLEQRCRELKIEPPGSERVDRMVRTALAAHDERFCSEIHNRLPKPVRDRLDALLERARES